TAANRHIQCAHTATCRPHPAPPSADGWVEAAGWRPAQSAIAGLVRRLRRLAAQSQCSDQRTKPLWIFAVEILDHAAALPYHHEQAATGVVVVLVFVKVRR